MHAVDIPELLHQAERAGIVVEVADGEVSFTFEKGKAPAELLKQLKAHKPQILRYLTGDVAPEDEPYTGPRIAPRLKRMSDVEPEQISWLWPGRIALGKLTMLSGDPGLGKSFITLDLAARVSTGRPWPDSPTVRNQVGSVILLSCEDELSDTVRPRLDFAKADVSRIHALEGVYVHRKREDGTEETVERMMSLQGDLEALEAAIVELGDCRLVIIDPISAYLGNVDSHKNAEVRSVLGPLGDLAARHNVAILGLNHLNKGAGGAALYRSIGSIAFVAAARAAWLVAKDKDDPQRRLVLPAKCNLAPDIGGLAYRIAGDSEPHIEWEEGTIDVRADDALSGISDPDERAERMDAREWLAEFIGPGEASAREIFAEGRKAYGFSEKVLRRAFRDMNGMTRKAGVREGWYWSLGSQDDRRSQDSQDDSQDVFSPSGESWASWTSSEAPSGFDWGPDVESSTKNHGLFPEDSGASSKPPSVSRKIPEDAQDYPLGKETSSASSTARASSKVELIVTSNDCQHVFVEEDTDDGRIRTSCRLCGRFIGNRIPEVTQK